MMLILLLLLLLLLVILVAYQLVHDYGKVMKWKCPKVTQNRNFLALWLNKAY